MVVGLRAVLSVFAIAVVVVGCTRDEGSAADLCRRLSEPTPDDRWNETDLVIFVDPDATDEQVDAIRRDLDDSPELDGYSWVSRQEAYDELVERFADRPELIDATSPEIMPPNARVHLPDADEASVRDLAARFEGRPGVYRVVEAPDWDTSIIEFRVRPLTSPLTAEMSMFAAGRMDLGLGDVAPPDLRDAARVVDDHWAQPRSATAGSSDQVTDAARQLTAFYDTECR